MTSVSNNLKKLKEQLPEGVTLVAVSKTKPPELIMEAYNTGHRIFGENKVQELADKYEVLPRDIEWHMIGHLQRNKVKYIAPFVSLIHGVDSLRLLRTIDKEGGKNNRIIPCLLQMHIASEETKFGLDKSELFELLESEELQNLSNVRIKGLMGMATYSDDETLVTSEFRYLKQMFEAVREKYFPHEEAFSILSIGMSGDYHLALKEGSNMVRIGSVIFGERQYH
ncbi:MAG: YggS family pyridoxal phosphate-dependent enzyme [Marinilabilia sp.]